ncbi:MAG: translation initiation factor IF-2 [Deltaproteobacteria bacterium]|nr:translation initiation factor IF-2 [Deltaproteobacteria bacterium]
MEEKTQIQEKRIKTTLIRRRKVEAPPLPPAEEAKKEEAGGVAAEPAGARLAPRGLAAGVKTAASAKEAAPVGTADAAQTATSPAPAASRAPADKEKPGEEKKEVTAAEEEEEKAKQLKLKKIPKKGGGKEVLEVEGIGRVSTITQLTRIAHADRLERVFQPTRGGRKKRIIPRKGQKQTVITVSKQIKRIVEMTKSISVADLAGQMQVKASAVIAKLMGMGMMAAINQEIDFDTVSLVAQEFQYEVRDVGFNEQKALARGKEGEENLTHRPPVVTVMGHVDHGKTSLLDAIRQTSVAEGEAGGITQHIGAYTVALGTPSLPKGKITFLDTPGHEAFTAMRARGASVTDLVILVVAADDGIMPQTVESIDHAKAAKVPIVVAINKIDKPEANVERIKRQLADHGLSPEEWGGDTLMALVSAKKKTGIEDLLESILLQAEVLQLKADPNRRARGVVIEAKLDRTRGPVATVLVQEGTLRLGDIIIAGSSSGRVRAMTDHRGAPAEEAPPSYAVEILGLGEVPSASDPFHVMANEESAQQVVEHRIDEQRKAQAVPLKKVSLEDLFARVQEGEVKELRVVLKADVQGSVEAVSEAIKKLSTPKVAVNVIHAAVGGVNESDVLLASASNAIIVGFNVRPETKALSVAKGEGVDVKLYKIIYEMVNDVKQAMEGLLAPTKKENYLGRAEVRQTFTVSKVGTIAGSFVIDGKITRSASLRLLRNNVVVYEGKVASLKRVKDDAREVTSGLECGIGLEGYQDIKPKDVIEAFEIELIRATL